MTDLIRRIMASEEAFVDRVDALPEVQDAACEVRATLRRLQVAKTEEARCERDAWAAQVALRDAWEAGADRLRAEDAKQEGG